MFGRAAVAPDRPWNAAGSVQYGSHIADFSEKMEGATAIILKRHMPSPAPSHVPAAPAATPSAQCLKFLSNIITRFAIDVYGRACLQKTIHSRSTSGDDSTILLATTGGEPIAGLLPQSDVQHAEKSKKTTTTERTTVSHAAVGAVVAALFPGELGSNAAELCVMLDAEFHRERGAGRSPTLSPGDIGLTLSFGVVYTLLTRTHQHFNPTALAIVYITAVLEFFLGEIWLLAARSGGRDCAGAEAHVIGKDAIERIILQDLELSQVVSKSSLLPHTSADLAGTKEAAKSASTKAASGGTAGQSLKSMHKKALFAPSLLKKKEDPACPRLCYRCGLTGHLAQDCSTSTSSIKHGHGIYGGEFDEELSESESENSSCDDYDDCDDY